jgi:hypothetical protein
LDSDDQWFQKAWSLYRTRTAANFDPFWLCTEDVTLLALARAAADIGELDMARKLQADAVDSGSNEAAQLCIS